IVIAALGCRALGPLPNVMLLVHESRADFPIVFADEAVGIQRQFMPTGLVHPTGEAVGGQWSGQVWSVVSVVSVVFNPVIFTLNPKLIKRNPRQREKKGTKSEGLKTTDPTAQPPPPSFKTSPDSSPRLTPSQEIGCRARR